MADGVWEGVYPLFFGHSCQLSLNKFFDPRNCSMRKGCDGEENGMEIGEKEGRKKLSTIVVASRSPECDIDKTNKYSGV